MKLFKKDQYEKRMGVGETPSQDEIKQAMDVLVRALETDPAYRMGWQANIAMAFKDEHSQTKPDYLGMISIHEVANKAAERFLNLLCYRG